MLMFAKHCLGVTLTLLRHLAHYTIVLICHDKMA